MAGLSDNIVNEFIKPFESIFSELLILGYYSMIKEKSYSLEMEEEELTAELIKHIEGHPFREEYLISIIPEPRYYNEDVYNHKKKPKEAAKPDIIFLKWVQSWQLKIEIKYYTEAKNLSEHKFKSFQKIRNIEK